MAGGRPQNNLNDFVVFDRPDMHLWNIDVLPFAMTVPADLPTSKDLAVRLEELTDSES